MRIWLLGLIASLLLASLQALAQAQSDPARKVALVIGNSSYLSTSILANPGNDAQLVAQALGAIGFHTVTLAENLDVTEFRSRLRAFREIAKGAAIALVYFAGHGIEAKGVNWLLPTDAKLLSEEDLPDEAVDSQRMMDATAGAKLRVVILDACRNNPFGRSWRSGTRSVASGLARLDVDDVLVIYAAAPGDVASDGVGRPNSPFAEALAMRLQQTELAVQFLGGSVRDDVLKLTGNKQRPFVSASITGKPVYLASSRPSSPVPPTLQPDPQPQPPPRPRFTGTTFDVVPLCDTGANFRQARERIRLTLSTAGLIRSGSPPETQLLFSTCIFVKRSELIGRRTAQVELTVRCLPQKAGSTCPREIWEVVGEASDAGSNFDLAEEKAIDAALEKLLPRIASDLGKP